MLDFTKHEDEILAFWKHHKIFDAVRKKNKGKKKWSFIDGPITANNPMGVHHAWGRTYKDLFHRFKAMQGHEMRYQNGFDCQGLWVEREEEKDLGLKNKSDIERFGILKFVQACRKRVEKFSAIQRDQSIRLGQWMDWDHSYYTMTDQNNLHNWHLLKHYFDKGWLYKGKDAVPWCWRCGTASSKHDIATEGYKEVTHTALYLQFPIKEKLNEYLLVFTTTPWTIPADVALAVNPALDYVKADVGGVFYWLAESRLEELEEEYTLVDKKKGSNLVGFEYVMPYADLGVHKDTPFKVVAWDLASGEEGTGIVHIAPGCGAEDFDLGKKEKLPAISPLDDAGVYKEGYGEFSLRKYTEVNAAVLHDLDQRRFVYKTKPIKHRYPHCWRCGEELVFRLVDEWYIKCKDMRDKLIKENKKTTWYPEYGKKRQEEWFKNMGDWLISRKRYWGLPLPIWECSCGHTDVFGSLEELRKKAVDPKKVDNLPEVHRPWVDEIEVKCEKCGKHAQRVLDVGDAWLDAGIVMFSTLDYLGDRKHWKEWYPADLISENMPGQYRGWFNAVSWAGVALSGKMPFKAMFGYETLKDEKGDEMHKSKGNAIWFDDAVKKIGADSMRLLYCLQDPAQEMRFGFNVVKEPQNSLNILFNVSRLVEKTAALKKITLVEDKWILSKFNSLIVKVSEELEAMHPHQAARALQNFWLNDFSRGYVQFVRDRLSGEEEDVKKIITHIYVGLLQLCAPIIPFITEKIWQEFRAKNIVSEESVHLCDWPKADKKKIDAALETEFDSVLKVLEKGLAERDKAKIGLRWPLAAATVTGAVEWKNDFSEIIARQLNVKKVILKKTNDSDTVVTLNTELTSDLEAEGYAREVARKVQAERKKAGLQKGDAISLTLDVSKNLEKMLSSWSNFIKERTNSTTLAFHSTDDKNVSEFVIRDEKVRISFH